MPFEETPRRPRGRRNGVVSGGGASLPHSRRVWLREGPSGGGQVEGSDQEDGHLVAAHRAVRAVADRVGGAAAGEALAGELLDPGGSEGVRRHVGEHRARGGWRNEERSMLGPQ